MASGQHVPLVIFWVFVAAALTTAVYYVTIAGPHIIHYLSYNFHVPGLSWFVYNRKFLPSLAAVLKLSPVTSKFEEDTSACKGCQNLQKFDGDMAPDIFMVMKNFTCRKIKHLPYNHLCLRPYSGDQISFAWTMFGYYELHYRIALEELFGLFPDANFLDIGANIGSHSLFAASNNRRVVAVDANPFNLKLLRKSVELNGFHETFELFWNAVTQSNGNISIRWEIGQNLEGNSQVCTGDCKNANLMASGKIFEVPGVTLNDLAHYLAEHETHSSGVSKRKQWIAKIDIEGEEPAALESSEDLLGKHAVVDIPVILMEYRTALNEHPDRTRDLVRRFYEYGYCAYSYTPYMTGYYFIDHIYFEDWPHDVIMIKQADKCNENVLAKYREVILGPDEIVEKLKLRVSGTLHD